MATYPDAPGHRMAYDRDGSAVVYWTGGIGATGTITTLTNAAMVLLNNESSDTAVNFGGTTYGFAIIFPELRDIDGFHVNTENNYGNTFQTSSDTTNGQDGTWVTRMASFAVSNTSANGWYRGNINGLAVSNVKAVRMNEAYSQYSWHLYGKPSPGANPDRLIFWHPTLNQELAANSLDPGDHGDVTRGQTYNVTFRVKNNSATKTATNVTLSTEALTDNSPSVVNMYTISYDGGAFGANATIPSIAPGGISNVCTLRFVVSPTAQTVVASPRVNAIPQTYA
jgi:hypothetical protein